MKVKDLERQVRDLQGLIDELQDTHAELKAAIISKDLGEASMHAHDLVDSLDCIRKDYAGPLTEEIDSYQDDDDDYDPRAHAKARLKETANELGIKLVA